MAKARPFVKWAGGKTQLLSQLEALLPADFDQQENLTYIEPFVDGGAMLSDAVNDVVTWSDTDDALLYARARKKHLRNFVSACFSVRSLLGL